VINSKRIMSNIIYNLKRRGFRIELYRDIPGVADRKTGITPVTRQKQVIRKAAVLPATLDSKFSYDLSYVAANKNFTYGGILDINTINILIDERDLSWSLTTTDYVIFEEIKYHIRIINNVPGLGFIGLVCTAVIGEPKNQIVEVAVEELLQFTETLAEVVE